jgi:hypothetical protein
LHLLEREVGPGFSPGAGLLETIRKRRRDHEDVVMTLWDAVLTLSECFAEEPFDAVAHDSLTTDLSTHRDPQSAVPAVVWGHEQGEQVIGRTPIVGQNGPELMVAQQPAALGKSQRLQRVHVICETKHEVHDSSGGPTAPPLTNHYRRYSPRC